MTEQFRPLFDACERHRCGEPLNEADLALLTRIGWMILNNEDARPLFHGNIAGRPSADHDPWVAIAVLSRADPTSYKERIGKVADEWRLSDRRVRTIVEQWREHVLPLLPLHPAVIEEHRTRRLESLGERNVNRRAASKTARRFSGQSRRKRKKTVR